MSEPEKKSMQEKMARRVRSPVERRRPLVLSVCYMSGDRGGLSYFEDPAKYVRGNPYIKYRSRVVRHMLAGLNGASVLDVGAGSGEVTIPLLQDGNRILFLDSSQGMINLALSNVPIEYRENVTAVCSSVMAFSPITPFDAVVCIGVLAHVSEWSVAVRRLASWVAPGGALVLQVTDHAAPLGRLSHRLGSFSSGLLRRAKHRHQRTRFPDLAHTLATLGFALSEARRHCFVPGLRVLPDRFAAAVVDSLSEAEFARRHGGEIIATFRRLPSSAKRSD
jgi:ubiquinone/menaquinone biosynthesis C-methylase UbiE